MYYVLVGVLAFIVGGLAGFYGGVAILKKKMSNMKMSDKEIQSMARSMGMNLNQKQLNNISRNMQKSNQMGKSPKASKKK